MDNNYLAELLFGDIKTTPEDMFAKYPARTLPDKAAVTRFAPSPTGFMHIGGLYAALISMCMARQSDGVFYLRLEDTDKKREIEHGADEIITSLAQYGVCFDEGAAADGEAEKGSYGPYRQSMRKEIYQTFAKDLVKRGLAYPCFCSAEELDEIRKAQEAEKADMGYYGSYAKCRNLSIEEIEANIKAGKEYVLRLRSDGNAENKITCRDLIRGNIEMPENIMDVVLLKSDGIPTYHFAHVVDDFLMGTTHVIRGDEWISSYPLHEQLFRASGLKMPKYAHIAPIMKLDGGENKKRKLSKRKDPEAAVGFYAEQGFPSVSVLEYLMTIANSNYEEWHAAHADKTIDDFTLSLKKMPVSGALFDMVKLNDVSKEMISKLTAEECYDLIMEWAKEHDENIYTFGTQDKDGFMKTINLWKMSGKKVRKDVGKWSDLRAMFGYLYTPEDELDLQYEIDEKYTPEMITEVIEEYKKDLFLDSEDWFSSMKVMGEKIGYCPNVKEYKQNPDGYKGSITDVCTIVRVAITGKQNSPDLFTIMNVIGKDKTMGRLDKFLAWVNR